MQNEGCSLYNLYSHDGEFRGSVLPLSVQDLSDTAMAVVVIFDFVIGIAGLVFLLTDFARNQLWLEEGEIVLRNIKEYQLPGFNKPFMIFTWIYLIGAFCIELYTAGFDTIKFRGCCKIDE